MSKGKILFQLSGSIACYKSCFAISRLVQAGYDLEIVATPSALKFVGQATLEGLSGKPIHIDAFETGQAMAHIHLVRWADLIVLAPASANSISKMANGIADDIVSTLFLAHDFTKPYLIAPAMNSAMYLHPATRASIDKLTNWGVTVLKTGTGQLACGESGSGRMLEPEELIQEIESRLVVNGAAPRSRKRILLTSGGTRESIDGVRFITNFSTGRTGSLLAYEFALRGHEITLLHSEGAVLPAQHPSIKLKKFRSFEDLESALLEELSQNHYDFVFHAAAVSDYSVDSVEAGGRRLDISTKIDSTSDISIKLKSNPKLIDQIRRHSRNQDVRVIAFKLTNTRSPLDRARSVVKLASRSQPDWIIHNDLNEIADNGTDHIFSLFRVNARNGAKDVAKEAAREVAKELIREPVAQAKSKAELATLIQKLIIEESLVDSPSPLRQEHK